MAAGRDLVSTRSKSSARWLKEHFSDPYVKRAQSDGWRSRAAFKLEELDSRHHLFRPGLVVVDLGAAPGSWSQMARARLGQGGRVIAVDLLPMAPLAGVEFIQGDFREESVAARLDAALDGTPVDLVLSDMAPNISGVDAVDQPRSMYLAELARDFAVGRLRKGGSFLVKLFQGSGVDAYLRELRSDFSRVSIRKPGASRSRSTEVYAFATDPREKPRGMLYTPGVTTTGADCLEPSGTRELRRMPQ